MEAHDNKQLALLKAISSHDDAAAAISDLMEGAEGENYRTMLGRIEQNKADLKRVMAGSKPEDVV